MENSQHNKIKDIWTKFIDVQEQLLRLRQEPISILPGSLVIAKKTLCVKIDENCKVDCIFERIIELFGIDESQIDKIDGIVKSNNYIDKYKTSALAESAQSSYIKFYPAPCLYGQIHKDSFAIDANMFKLPDVVSELILFDNISCDTLLNCNYKVCLNVTNGYLKRPIEAKLLQDIGLSLFEVIYVFTIHPDYFKGCDKEKIERIFGKRAITDNEIRLNIYHSESTNSHSKDTSWSLWEKEWDTDWDFAYTLHKRTIDRVFGADNYDFECKFSYTFDALKSVEIGLKNNFPSIRTRIDEEKGVLKFYQEYTPDTKNRLHKMLCSELPLLAGGFDIDFTNKMPLDYLYFFEADRASQSDNIQTRIKELRGAEFIANGISLGKLSRVSYPNLTFDISESDISEIEKLCAKKSVSYISPNLTGDIEKMFRLKDSFRRIVTGDRLNNKMLPEYIFDSIKAKPISEETKAISMRPDSEYYQDIKNNLLNKRINDSQIEAVVKTLLAADLAIIQGPPGTGKSTAIAEIIWQHIRKNQKELILLTSETNLAVDNAIDRVKNSNNNLVKPIRFGVVDKLEAEGRQFSIDAMKRWVESGDDEDTKVILVDWINNIAHRVNIEDPKVESIWLNILQQPEVELRTWFYENYIKGCNLVGATCSSIGDLNSMGRPTGFYKNYSEIFGVTKTYIDKQTGITKKKYLMPKGKGIEFTTVIQDEASKATPAELSLPLIYGKKAIVIGDHRQLPPMLDREEFISSMEYLMRKATDKREQKTISTLLKYVRNNFEELELSHFERLFTSIDDSLKGLFNLQYRMHPDINDVIKQFYIQDGGLECGLITPSDLGVDDADMSNSASRYHGIDIDGFVSENNHVIWIDTQSPELLDGTSRINHGEVDAIRWVLSQFQNSDSYQSYQNYWNNEEDKQIGIISFYGKQLKLLEDIKKDYRDIPMRISTVDRFQGMERNIVIVSMVRSNRIASDKSQRPDVDMYGELGYQAQSDLGFAKSPNRLNVALSRAKRLLIIVGNSDLFRQNTIYDNVYKTIERNPNGRIIKYSHYDRL